MVALDPDLIVDRRRIKRRLSVWRFLAVLAAVIAALAVAYAASDSGLPFARKDHIAAVDIDGIIVGRHKLIKLIDKIAESKSAKALVVRIDSPGGTTAGAEALYEALRKVAADKPIVAVMETVAASGGYIVALAADHVIARGNTVTGSIGVLFQWAEIDEAMASLGIKLEEIKSGPLKASPSLFGTTTEEARVVTREMVRDTHEWFLRLVSERRGIALARSRVLGDGRVYTGRQALDARLIDAIGGEDDAKRWLVEARGINKDLDIVDWETDSITDISVSARLASWLAGALGLDRALGRIGTELPIGSQRLDGLLSLWHPELHR